MDERGPIHIWVRTQKGAVFGPLIPSTVELLIDQGAIQGPIQIALDGKDYMYPGRVPGIRMVIPRELWGDSALPEHPKDREWAGVALPPTVDGSANPVPTGSQPAIRASGVAPGAPTAPAGPVVGPVLPPVVHRPRSATQPRYVPGAKPSAPGSSASAVMRNPTLSPPAPVAPTVAEAPAATTVSPPAPPQSAPAAAKAAVSAPPPSAPRSATHAAVVVPVTESIPEQGDLAAFAAPRAYFIAAATEATALLTLTLPDRTLTLHFRKGSPDFVDSTHVDDSVGTVLVKNKLLTPDAVQKAEAEKARFGGELVPALFGLGLVNPNSALTHLMQRATAILQRALLAEQGTFTWQAREFQGQKAFPLGNKWGLFVEQLRKTAGPEIRRRIAGSLDLPVVRGSSAVLPADLRLTPQETRALTYFDGTRSLHQLAREVPADAELAMRTAWMLSFTGLVGFAGVRPISAPPASDAPYPGGPAPSSPSAAVAPVSAPAPAAGAPAAPPPAAPVQRHSPVPAPAPAAQASSPSKVQGTPVAGSASVPRPPGTATPVPAPAPGAPGRPVVTAAPAAPVAAKPRVESSPTPTPTVNFDEELKKAVALRDQFKKSTHFEVLGLDKNADAGAVKAAYFKLARTYHPDMVAKEAPAELARVKADIFAIVGDANRVLSDAKLRKDYLLELEMGGADKLDMQAIMRGEELFRKGSINVKARKFAEGLKLIDEAIAANADEPEFYAWRGFARFFTIADKKAAGAAALPDIEKCLQKNPRVAAAWYFKGVVQKGLGDNSGAKTSFKKCVELDANHIDAQRELRMMK